MVKFSDKTSIAIHPNPARDYLRIAGLSGITTISLVNALGRLMQEKVRFEGNTLDVNSTNYPAGLYQLNIIENDLITSY